MLAACAAGAWPTHAVAGPAGFVGMAGGAGLALVGAIVGFLPLRSAAARRGPEHCAQAWLIGLGLRLFLTMGVLFGFWGAEVAWRAPLLIWTGVLYVVLLALETVVVARTMRAFPAPGAPGATPGGATA